MAALKTVPAAEVRLGMFIHGFEGSWWEHPFWRTRFLLTDLEDLQKLRAFQGGVIIDVARSQVAAPGIDTPAAAVGGGEEAGATAALPAATAKRAIPESPAARFSTEQAQAAALVAGALDTVRGTFEDVRLGRAIAHEKVAALVDDIAGQLDRNASALLRVLQLKSKHQYTYLHSVAVCTLMVNLARHLAMDDEAVRTLGLAGLLHDVGKVAIPDAVLDKPGRLSPEEFALVRTHPEEGVALLREDGAMPALAVEVCLHHHERWDGNGYPHGLKADDISLPARMGAICDVYDALTSHRAYKRAWLPARALGAMWSWDGHFDRDLLFQFMRSINLYPPGMLVRLASDRLALVLDNGGRATRTRLLVFHSLAEDSALTPRSLVLTGGAEEDRVIGFIPAEEAPSAIPSLDLYPPVAVTN
ncbi:HDIG domain-containing protein [Sphingomonas sp. NFR04]|uniref:HD-GYP domain-containing protein n=1 Tax=Sphingomonas sp. NFR04 TaxID=1566283 RepID=UPI0008EC67B5|nr:HD-GYP domain-containing protein [Sphingomonas sp. NFR04]SFJ59354.1 HDIG domain-containing protein [Sphingomonas sp. NFR04]